MRFWLSVVLASGCSFTPGSVTTDGRVGTDVIGMTDARPDTPPGQLCVGTGLHTECYAPGSEPTGTFAPAAGEIDTDLDANCDEIVAQTGGPELCIKRAANITIAEDLTLTGERAYVLLAAETVTIESSATIDFSYVDNAPTTGCSAQAGGNDLGGGASAGAGGGGGGSYGSAGAKGGNGQGSGTGGNPGATLATSLIRGGCPGAKGGNSSDGDGGAGGRPGGAIYVMAGTSISLVGNLLANGGGGQGGANKAGGGGGGSGGLIALDAPTVTIDSSADVAANGGAGGEGGGGGNSGGPGEDATGWDTRPDGGTGNSNGSNGGNGAHAATIAATPGATGGDGGGGGGAGFGMVRVFATTLQSSSTKISPPSQ